MARPESIDPPRPLWGASAALFAIVAVAFCFKGLVEVFEETKAMQPAEFPAGEALFSAYEVYVGIVRWGAVLLPLCLLADAALLLRRGRPDLETRVGVFARLLAVCGSVVVLLGFHHGFLLLGLGFFLAFLARETRRLRRPGMEGAAEAVGLLEGRRLRDDLNVAFEIALLPALGFMIVAALELLLFTRTFVGGMISGGELRDFSLLALAASALTGARFGVEFALVLGIARMLARPASPRGALAEGVLRFVLIAATFSFMVSHEWVWEQIIGLFATLYFVRWWCGRYEERAVRLVALPVVAAIYFWARTRDLVLDALSDEIDKLGVDWVIQTTFGLLSMLLLFWAQSALREIYRRFRPTQVREVLATLIVAAVLPPMRLLVGLLGRGCRDLRAFLSRAASLGVASLLVLGLMFTQLNYPLISDFSQVAQVYYSVMIGLCSFFIVLLVRLVWIPGALPRGRMGAVATTVLVIVSGLVYFWFEARSNLRMIGAQYGRIVREVIVTAKVLPERPRVLLCGDRCVETTARDGGSRTYPVIPEQGFFEKRRPPIFFFLWDAARADHMSFQGYPRETTPAAAALARDSIVFENAYSNSTATTHSIRHLFTGMYSDRYMLATDHPSYFNGDLARVEGYDWFFLNVHGSDYNGVSSDAFVRNQAQSELVRARTKFFPEYEEQNKIKRGIKELRAVLAERADREHPADGIFMYLHCASMHFPWHKWPDHQDYGDELLDLYDNSIGHGDTALGDFLDYLREAGIYDDAIIILTADHGTGLNEHGKYGGFQPYEEQIHVPLVIKVPGVEPRRVTEPVAGLDLPPTILSLFRPGQPNPHDGHSLIGLMNGSVERLDREYLVSFCAFEDALALRDVRSGWKLHFHRAFGYEQLYDLDADPGERRNLVDDEPERVQRYVDYLQGFMCQGLESYANPFFYREFDRTLEERVCDRILFWPRW